MLLFFSIFVTKSYISFNQLSSRVLRTQKTWYMNIILVVSINFNNRFKKF